MFQEFNANNISTNFIKNLVSTVYVPTVDVWNKNKPLIAGFTYITKDYIVKANKNYDPVTYYDLPDKKVLDIYNKEYFTIIKPYIEGKFYRGLTSIYTPNTSIYDSETHYYLGNYLRYVRDIHNINLMPYYNCWDGTMRDSIRIKHNISNDKDEIIEDNENINDGKKVLIVPIKFNTKYTLYIDSNSPIDISYIYYDGVKRLNPANQPQIIGNPDIIHLPSSSFTNPYLFNGVNLDSSKSDYSNVLQEYLVLLIQLPSIDTSSVFVLEGDYKDNKILTINDDIDLLIKYYGKDNFDYLNFATTPSSLTRVIDGKNYAFNDRLIEYLTWNIMSSQDTISDNIKRCQLYSSTSKCELKNGYKWDKNINGIWSNSFMEFSYELATNNKINKLLVDINGNIDKDTEEAILRGKEGDYNGVRIKR